MSLRTIQRCLSEIKRAEAEGRSPLEALVRNYDNCGSPQPHIDEEYDEWNKVCNEHYMKNTAPTVISVAAIYRTRCEARGITPVSAETIRRRVKKLDRSLIVREQDGTFAAYFIDNFVPQDRINRLVKGRIPGEVAHVDSTPASITLVCPVTGIPSPVSAWRTVMRDAASFRVLGHVVYYGSPSYEALYRLLIEVVKRTDGWLPQYIVCDRALEFKCRQWQSILGRYGVVLLFRPVRRPRHGQPVESGNRKDDIETTLNLEGHAKPDVDYRTQLEEFAPAASAIFSLSDLRRIFDNKYYEIEPQNRSSRTGKETILEFEKRVLSQIDDSHMRKVQYNEEFIQLCMPEVPDGGKRAVTPRGSVHVSRQEYFSPVLKDPELISRKLVVHYDPDNIGRVFVWGKKQWIECHSDKYAILARFTEYERMDYQAYLLGSDDVKSKPKADKEEQLHLSLEEFRETARGRVARIRALENMGVSVELAEDVEFSEKVDASEDDNAEANVDSDVSATQSRKAKQKQKPKPEEDDIDDDLEVPLYTAFADRLEVVED